MAKFVKTGEEIHKIVSQEFGKIGGYEAYTNKKSSLKEQWVSLSWLQERIRNEIDSYSGRSPVDHAVQAGLNRVLEILQS